MPSAIPLIVDAHVKLKDFDSLNRLKEQRTGLIRDLQDREHFNVKSTRRHSEDDLAVIEVGIRTLREKTCRLPILEVLT